MFCLRSPLILLRLRSPLILFAASLCKGSGGGEKNNHRLCWANIDAIPTKVALDFQICPETGCRADKLDKEVENAKITRPEPLIFTGMQHGNAPVAFHSDEQLHEIGVKNWMKAWCLQSSDVAAAFKEQAKVTNTLAAFLAQYSETPE
eukprot:6464063-Amphidinium_carterae.1